MTSAGVSRNDLSGTFITYRKYKINVGGGIKWIHWVFCASLNQIQLVIFRKKVPAITQYATVARGVRLQRVYEREGQCHAGAGQLGVCPPALGGGHPRWAHAPSLSPLLPFCLASFTSLPFSVKPQDQHYKIQALLPPFYSADRTQTGRQGWSHRMTEELARKTGRPCPHFVSGRAGRQKAAAQKSASPNNFFFLKRTKQKPCFA